MDTLHRIAADLGARFNDATRLAGTLISHFPPLSPPPPLFASITGPPRAATDEVAKTLTGTSVYTVSNSDNEFVLVSDPSGEGRSISLVCFRREDAEAILAQVMARRKELKIQGKVVPMTLDQLKASDRSGGFDGVPVFQRKKKHYSPIYFRKEDLDKELHSRLRGASVSQHIVVGSLEDVLRKMETSDESSGWGDLIFIPPGKSYSDHI